MLLLDSSVCGLFKWRQFEPEVILLAVGWYLRFSLSYRDVQELLGERGLRADHVTVWRWSSGMRQKWNAVCAPGSDRPTTVGEWTKPTSESRASGSIYTGLSTPQGQPLTSFCRLNAARQRPSAFSPRPWAERKAFEPLRIIESIRIAAEDGFRGHLGELLVDMLCCFKIPEISQIKCVA